MQFLLNSLTKVCTIRKILILGLYWRLRPSDIEIEMTGYSRKLLTEILPEDSGNECNMQIVLKFL